MKASIFLAIILVLMSAIPAGAQKKKAAGVTGTPIEIRTTNTALTFAVMPDGRVNQAVLGSTAKNPAFDVTTKNLSFEAYPPAGDGYLFEPALRVVHSDGNSSTDLKYENTDTKKVNDDVSETRINLKDPAYPFSVALCFKAYQKEDVIEQWVEIKNGETGPVTLYNFASSALIIPEKDTWLTQFTGDYSKEMTMVEEKLTQGIKIIDSKMGVRAHYYNNPSFLLSLGGQAKEDSGTVLGGQLGWSGSFQLAFELTPTNQLRAITGINPFASQYPVKPGETFTTPALIWSMSDKGKGQVSRNFQAWGRKYGVRDGDKERAVLLNNWEATDMNFDENKLVSLFDGAKEMGLELFLLDDGWFANKYPRDNDKAGLGDWQPNVKKLPHGVSYLTAEAKKRGLRFGIWFEPEMVNPKSELYEKHPDWVIQQPKRDLTYFRNQLILDLTRPEVHEFVFNTLDDLLTKNPDVSYVKWDANRFVTQPGSTYLKPEEQSKLWIDYTRALYDIMERVAKKHPSVEMMVCSGGGGRVDYGSLRYFQEFWPSDKTDPLNRVFIQYGYSHFFPAVATAAHVTRMGNRPIKFAFDVAMSQRMGMDVDLAKFTPEEKKFTAAAIATYKRVRDMVLQGDQYRLESPYASARASINYVSADKKHALLFVYQIKNAAGEPPEVKPQGLDPKLRYKVQEINLAEGAKPTLKENGRTLFGVQMMRDGLVTGTSKRCDSVVVELTAE